MRKKLSTACGITVSDSTCVFMTSCLVCSSACIVNMNSPEQESVWPSSNVWWYGTVDAYGRIANRAGKRYSVSAYQEKRRLLHERHAARPYSACRGYGNRCGDDDARTQARWTRQQYHLGQGWPASAGLYCTRG